MCVLQKKCEEVGYTYQYIDVGWIVRVTNTDSVPLPFSDGEQKDSIRFFFSLDPELFLYNKKQCKANYFDSNDNPSLDYFEKFHGDKNLEKEYLTGRFELFEDEYGFIELVDEQTLNSIINPMRDDVFIEFMKEKHPIFMSVYLSDYKKHLSEH